MVTRAIAGSGDVQAKQLVEEVGDPCPVDGPMLEPKRAPRRRGRGPGIRGRAGRRS